MATLSRHSWGPGGYCDTCGTTSTKGVISSFAHPKMGTNEVFICDKCIINAAEVIGVWSGSSQKANDPSKKPLNSILMNINAFAKRHLNKDTKTLIKAGFMDEQLSLTGYGKETLMALLLESNMTALVKEAEEEIAEKEKKS